MANAWIINPMAAVATDAGATSIGDKSYVLNDYAGVIWGAAGGTMGGSGPYSHYLGFDMGAAVTIDTIAVFGLPTNISSTAVFFVAGSNDPSFSTGVTFSPTAPLYAGSIFGQGRPGCGLWSYPGSLPAARYYRLFWQGAAQFDLTVSRIVIGQRLVLERNFSFGAAFGVRDLGSLDFSRRAVLIRNRGKKLRTVGLTFSNIRKDEVEAAVKPLLEQIGNTEMVALVTDPAADAQRQNRMYFGPLVGDLSMVWRNAAAWESKANIVSNF